MEIIKEIGLQVIEILTLTFGILGMTFSAMLVFSTNMTQNLSNILNRNISIEDKIAFLDRDIEVSRYFYSHNIVMGLMLIAGSAIALSFFYLSLDIDQIVKIFFDSPHQIFFGEILFESLLWVGKIACLAGLFFGSLLMFIPTKMKQWEDKLNSWFETKTMFEKLEKSSDNVDSFFFRHPIPVGLTGAFFSFIIISLSIINLLD